MNVSELSESYLLSLTLDNNNLYIELVLLAHDGEKYKVFASNKNTDPITVEFTGLQLRANLTTLENVPVLAEVESIEVNKAGISLEGDMGCINIIADNWYVDNAL